METTQMHIIGIRIIDFSMIIQYFSWPSRKVITTLDRNSIISVTSKFYSFFYYSCRDKSFPMCSWQFLQEIFAFKASWCDYFIDERDFCKLYSPIVDSSVNLVFKPVIIEVKTRSRVGTWKELKIIGPEFFFIGISNYLDFKHQVIRSSSSIEELKEMKTISVGLKEFGVNIQDFGMQEPLVIFFPFRCSFLLIINLHLKSALCRFWSSLIIKRARFCLYNICSNEFQGLFNHFSIRKNLETPSVSAEQQELPSIKLCSSTLIGTVVNSNNSYSVDSHEETEQYEAIESYTRYTECEVHLSDFGYREDSEVQGNLIQTEEEIIETHTKHKDCNIIHTDDADNVKTLPSSNGTVTDKREEKKVSTESSDFTFEMILARDIGESQNSSSTEDEGENQDSLQGIIHYF